MKNLGEFTGELQSLMRGGLLHGCTIVISSGSNSIRLEKIHAHTQQQGDGSRALQAICSLADQHGVTLTASVEPLACGTISKAKLHAWYRRAGFVRVAGDDIEREPRR